MIRARVLLILAIACILSVSLCAQLPSVDWLPDDRILWTYTSYIPEAQAVADSTPDLGSLFNDPTINAHFEHGLETGGLLTYYAVRSESLDVLTSQVVALDSQTGLVEWRYTILPDSSNVAYSVVHIDVRDGLLYVMGSRCPGPINRTQPNCTRVFSNPLEMHVLDAMTGDLIDIVNAVEEEAPLEIQYFLSNDRPPIMPRSDGSVFYMRSLDWIRTDYANAIMVSDVDGGVAVAGDTIAFEDRFNRTARLGHAFSDDSALFYYGSTVFDDFPNFSEAVVLLVNQDGEIQKTVEVDSLTNYLSSLITLDCNDEVCLIAGLSRFEDGAVQNANGSYPRILKVSLLVLDRQGNVVKRYKRVPESGNGGVMAFMNHRTGQVGFVNKATIDPDWRRKFEIYLEVDGAMKLVDSISVDTTTYGVEMADAVLSDDNTLSLAFYQIKELGARSTHHVVGVDLSDYLVTSTEDVADHELQDLLVIPNPASDRITLGGIEQDVIEYTIVDLLGRKCVAGRYEGEIDVSGLAPGIYHLIAQCGSGVSLTARLAKQ